MDATATLQRLKDLRPRWAWLCLALGLVWAITPAALHPGGCLAALAAAIFWSAVLLLAVRGLGWLWRKLLFKVSRRLWVILVLVSLLPALTLTVCFLSLGWLGLGAQVARSVQGTLDQHGLALREAGKEASDAQALQSLLLLGGATVSHAERLPPGLKPGFQGLIYDATLDAGPEDPSAGTALRLALPAGTGFRLLTLPLDHVRGSGRKLWGGRANYRLDWSRDKGSRVEAGRALTLEGVEQLTGVPPLHAWTEGDVAAGRGILRSFPLPPVTLRAVDWASGRPMGLTLTPETSLKELFMGYGFGQGNLSAKAVLAIVGLTLLVLALGAIQLVALLMGLVLARNLGKAVDGLFRGVGRLSGGDFSARVVPRGRDQVSRLAHAFNAMAERLEDAQGEHHERLRLEEELRVAREVQMRLLPDVGGLSASVQAAVLPAREVAGDYFDVFKLPDGRLAFLIADVSGKGTSAAFYAAETKGVLAALDKTALDPREVATRINAIWRANHPRNLFMTLIYGTFDPVDGAFAFVRAGHPPPMLARTDGSVERLAPRGLGIGLCDQAFAPALDVCTGRLGPGDSLVCYTDGLSEARDPEGQLFGEARLLDLLSRPCLDPKPVILAAITEFTQGLPLDDDLTLLILQG
jgi:serine phosphatase RsbU (regulator of sigma subunit)